MNSDQTPDSTPASMPNFQVRIPLEWEASDDIPMVYANQVMISHAGPEFFVVFGVVLPPDAPEQIPDSFRIQPQVRVVVSREAMPAIVKALNDNLARFRTSVARQQQPQDERQKGDGPPKAQDAEGDTDSE